MTSLIKMFVLIVLLSSLALISLLTDDNNYLDININYLSTGYFDNKKVVDDLIRNKELSDLINLNEFQKVEKELEKIKSIKSIDVYRNNYLQLEIDIKDREPIALIRELNSYMDSSGVIFKKYNYLSEFIDSDEKDGTAKFVEVFSSKKKKIPFRKNVHTLYMDDQSSIISIAKQVGFIAKSKYDMTPCSYEYNFLYVLKKPH